jgi:hypothetical protein
MYVARIKIKLLALVGTEAGVAESGLADRATCTHTCNIPIPAYYPSEHLGMWRVYAGAGGLGGHA